MLIFSRKLRFNLGCSVSLESAEFFVLFVFAYYAKSFAIPIIFYFFFFSTANLDGLAKLFLYFFSTVALGACEQY